MRRFVISLLAVACAISQALPRVSFLAMTRIGTVQPSPLTATKTRTTYSISPTGAIRLIQEERGTFSRNADGDEATHLKVMRDGHEVPGSSVVNLLKERLRYVIDDARQQYKVVPWSPTDTGTEADGQTIPAVTRTIEVTKCMAVLVSDNDGRPVGKDWVSLDYGLAVRSEMDVLDAQTGQVTGLVVEELTEIRVGETTEPSAFMIPAGYKQVGSKRAR